jgi:hypothetical protein
MRVALNIVLAAATLLGAPACHKQQAKPADQNIGIDEDGLNNGVAGNADIEELPPDESSGTSSNELQSGADNPDVNEANAPANSY